MNRDRRPPAPSEAHATQGGGIVLTPPEQEG